jgi:hypothetical protein
VSPSPTQCFDCYEANQRGGGDTFVYYRRAEAEYSGSPSGTRCPLCPTSARSPNRDRMGGVGEAARSGGAVWAGGGGLTEFHSIAPSRLHPRCLCRTTWGSRRGLFLWNVFFHCDLSSPPAPARPHLPRGAAAHEVKSARRARSPPPPRTVPPVPTLELSLRHSVLSGDGRPAQQPPAGCTAFLT